MKRIIENYKKVFITNNIIQYIILVILIILFSNDALVSVPLELINDKTNEIISFFNIMRYINYDYLIQAQIGMLAFIISIVIYVSSEKRDDIKSVLIHITEIEKIIFWNSLAIFAFLVKTAWSFTFIMFICSAFYVIKALFIIIKFSIKNFDYRVEYYLSLKDQGILERKENDEKLDEFIEKYKPSVNSEYYLQIDHLNSFY